MSADRVWIIEMKSHETKRWSPTVGCALSRKDAIDERALWEKSNPADTFRISLYVKVKA